MRPGSLLSIIRFAASMTGESRLTAGDGTMRSRARIICSYGVGGTGAPFRYHSAEPHSADQTSRHARSILQIAAQREQASNLGFSGLEARGCAAPYGGPGR